MTHTMTSARGGRGDDDRIITTTRLASDDDAWRTLAWTYRDEVCAWMSAHGIDPHWTLAIERDVIDAPLIRATIIEHPDGYMRVNADGTIATRTVEVAQRHPAPHWWQPGPDAPPT